MCVGSSPILYLLLKSDLWELGKTGAGYSQVAFPSIRLSPGLPALAGGVGQGRIIAASGVAMKQTRSGQHITSNLLTAKRRTQGDG